MYLCYGGEGTVHPISEFFIYIKNYSSDLFLNRGYKIDDLFEYNNLF